MTEQAQQLRSKRYCYNPSQHEPKSWKGWIVGSYVHAWLPANTHDWRNSPVLIVDIGETTAREIYFVVAYLYDRDAAIQRLQKSEIPAPWTNITLLRAWPKAFKYVVSNQMDTVYEWELRTWSRSNSESITPHWTIDILTNRLARSKTLLGTDTDMACDTNSGFLRFLELPSEIRDQIYDYALLDERQKISRSLIYIRSLLHKRKHDERGWPWHRDLSMPTLGPLPRLQTPNLFLVCRQIHNEALKSVYRTKVLVITVTSTADIFHGFDKNWSPLNMDHFLHIRVDLILHRVTQKIVRECFSRVASLLQEHTQSLQFLEFRIGLLEPQVTSPVREVGFQLVIEDIADGMRGLADFFQESKADESSEYKRLHISWGVSEQQKSVGDYSCACIYLRATYLNQLWSFICGGLVGDSKDVGLAVLEENCQDMGCKLLHY
jgi:hypothetical protein